MKGTYIIAIIVLYLDDRPGPRIERAFRAIHQIRPAERDCQTEERSAAHGSDVRNIPINMVTRIFSVMVANRKATRIWRKWYSSLDNPINV